MSILKIEYDPHNEFCILHHAYNKRFISFLKGGIKPSLYRKFDPDTKCWRVHKSRLPLVIFYGKKCFAHVDYRSLPENLQIKVVKILEDTKGLGSLPIFEAPAANPYAVLFVLETAPWEVISAAYKALALKYHPDRGGTTEEFQRIQKAYSELKEKQRA